MTTSWRTTREAVRGAVCWFYGVCAIVFTLSGPHIDYGFRKCCFLKGFPVYVGCDMSVVYELVLDEESLEILEKLLEEAEEENGEETGNTCS